MSLLPVGFGKSGGGGGPPPSYDIGHSLRFRSNASAYLNRTPSVSGNRKTWTFRALVKRGSLTDNFLSLFDCQIDGNNWATFGIYDSSVFWDIQVNGVFARRGMKSSAILRDPAAHYDIVFRVDTTQATDSDRIRVYINGQLQTMTTRSPFTFAYPTLNADMPINSTTGHRIGNRGISNDLYFDGYLSDVIFVDGQSLAPTEFGETDINGVWVPKVYSGTYGSNGFYLPFSNGSSLTTLTADASGNGNNWTANNISLTAGATYDWMEDTPTNNFAVLNPLSSKHSTTLTEGNLKETISGLRVGSRGTSIAMTSGKFYAEYTITGSGGGSSPFNLTAMFGIVDPNGSTHYPETTGVGYASYNGNKFVNGVSSAYGATWMTNGATYVLGAALDIDSGTVEFYLNGVSQGVITLPSTAGGWIFTWGWASSAGSGSAWANFGQHPFAYTPPTGFQALCTKNLPTPSIVNPSEHFQVKLDTGANIKATAEAVFPSNFLEWIKDRANSNNHQLIDTVRGTSAVLQSNTVNAETTYLAPSGNSVAWVWKAGGAAVANTNGSITSQVSANIAAGISIVSYTGTGANATVGHGLGVAPKMVIVKPRAAVSGAGGWHTWHTGLSGPGYLVQLQLTNAQQNAGVWNNSAPTSSVFSLGTNTGQNNNGTGFVAYCFAEVEGFSRINRYIGNGSADGPFVYCGFRPAFVMVKRSDVASDWFIVDSSRDPYNLMDNPLYPHVTNAEGTWTAGDGFDFLANGFKLRHAANANPNVSGGTYIFLAFAEAPFKYARAR